VQNKTTAQYFVVYYPRNN